MGRYLNTNISEGASYIVRMVTGKSRDSQYLWLHGSVKNMGLKQLEDVGFYQCCMHTSQYWWKHPASKAKFVTGLILLLRYTAVPIVYQGTEKLSKCLEL